MTETKRSFATKQFAIWGTVSALSFTLVVLTLQAVDAPIWAAVAAGLLLNEATEPLMEWLIDWLEAEKEVAAHA